MTSSTLTSSMGVFVAKTVKSQLTTTSNAYLVISQVKPWANDLAPPESNSSIDSIFLYWRNIIGGKKIAGSDISHVVPRQDWSNGSIYLAYDCDASTLYETSNLSYVMTDDYNVYKCLFNNGRANSYVKPVSTNPNTTYSTADGYVWKYMYTLSDVDRIKFLTPSWLPVKTLTGNDGSLQWRVQQSAVSGAIDIIRVEDAGEGYTNSSNISVIITGDGVGAAATATRNTTGNSIQSVIITSRGSGYSVANAEITGGGGSGAIIDVEIAPPGGHGSDAITELGGKYLMINTRIDASEGGKIPVVNDFRQLLLLIDPLAYAGNVFSGTAFNQTLGLTVTGTGATFAQDEVVFQGTTLETATFTGDVVEFDTVNNIVRVSNYSGTPVAGPLIRATTAASRYVTAVTDPDLRKNSGKILYIDNITPVARNSSQTEDFKIVISFL
jgi:hypothetical protein